MNKILKRIVTTALFVVMFTLAFKSTTPVQAATPTVKIFYNANGGVYANGLPIAQQTVKKGTYVNLAPPSIARAGYVFLGYAQNKNDSYPGYLLCNKSKFSNNVTLFAVWAKKSEIYDRYGDSFSYGVNMSKVSETLKLFSEKNWNGKSTYVKNTRANKLATELATLYGLSSIPKVAKGIPADKNKKNYNKENVYGLYKYEYNTLYLNPLLYEDDMSAKIDEKWVPACHVLAKTIAHELRHAYQYQRASKPQCRNDYLYAYNLGFYGYGYNYIDVLEDAYGNQLNYKEYQDQLVEAEAFGIENLLNPYLK